MDNNRLETSDTFPLINGLSDHDAPFLTINNICALTSKIPKQQRTRLINSYTLTTSLTLSEQGTWESLYPKPDTVCLTHF